MVLVDLSFVLREVMGFDCEQVFFYLAGPIIRYGKYGYNPAKSRL